MHYHPEVQGLSLEGVEDEEALEQELVRFIAGREFISYEENHVIHEALDELPRELREYGKAVYYRTASDFVDAECLKCSDAGFFRWHFLGKLTHPECWTSSYVGPGYYLKRQIRATFASGVDAAAGMVQPDKNGETPGFFGKVFLGLWGFTFGFVFRLVGTLLMLPVQAGVSLLQGKKFERIYTISFESSQHHITH